MKIKYKFCDFIFISPTMALDDDKNEKANQMKKQKKNVRRAHEETEAKHDKSRNTML
jgi:hypothetical protein